MAKKATQKGPIRILHLSDFHFSKERQWESDPVLAGLADKIGQIVKDGLKPDVVVITGDIADKRRKEDHDVDCNKLDVDVAFQALRQYLLDGPDQGRIDVLRKPGQRAILLKRHRPQGRRRLVIVTSHTAVYDRLAGGVLTQEKRTHE